MPRMNGYELARAIRQDEAARGLARMPIIACAANVLGSEVQACRDAGMDDHVPKPVEVAALMRVLDRRQPLPRTDFVPLEDDDAQSAQDVSAPKVFDRSVLAQLVLGQPAATWPRAS